MGTLRAGSVPCPGPGASPRGVWGPHGHGGRWGDSRTGPPQPWTPRWGILGSLERPNPTALPGMAPSPQGTPRSRGILGSWGGFVLSPTSLSPKGTSGQRSRPPSLQGWELTGPSERSGREAPGSRGRLGNTLKTRKKFLFLPQNSLSVGFGVSQHHPVPSHPQLSPKNGGRGTEGLYPHLPRWKKPKRCSPKTSRNREKKKKRCLEL